jgi:hypothetical protein
MEPTEQNLDPQLQDAIKRVHGGHAADDALRQRVAQLLAREPDPTRAAKQQRSPLRWIPRIAIAACLVLAGGVIEHIRHHREEAREYAAATNSLLEAMVKAHDERPTSVDAPVPASADPVAIAKDLSRELSRPLPTPDLKSQNWELKGAASRVFKGAMAARFDFSKDAGHVTLISLPTFAFAGAETGSTYDLIVSGHPISGYVTADGVHCVVGDPTMPLAELVSLRKQLQQIR